MGAGISAEGRGHFLTNARRLLVPAGRRRRRRCRRTVNSAFLFFLFFFPLISPLPCWPPLGERGGRNKLTTHPANKPQSRGCTQPGGSPGMSQRSAAAAGVAGEKKRAEPSALMSRSSICFKDVWWQERLRQPWTVSGFFCRWAELTLTRPFLRAGLSCPQSGSRF